MGFELFRIDLEAPNKVFYPGHIIAGQLLITTSARKKIKGIDLKIFGFARTKLLSKTLSDSELSDSGVESYIADEIHLLGNGTGDEILKLEKGNHGFRFQYELPLAIPSSFSHPYGDIKYYFEAVISSAKSSKKKYVARTPFEVHGVLDLNDVRLNLNPCQGGVIHREKNVGFLCCKSGPIGFSVSIPRIAFIPGELLPFSVHLWNFSTRSIFGIVVSLHQVFKFQTTNHWKVAKGLLIDFRAHWNFDRGHEIWKDELFEIPPLPPTNLGGSNIIGLEYFIRMRLEMIGSNPLEGSIPILIGTIGLGNHSSDLIPPFTPPQQSLPSMPMAFQQRTPSRRSIIPRSPTILTSPPSQDEPGDDIRPGPEASPRRGGGVHAPDESNSPLPQTPHSGNGRSRRTSSNGSTRFIFSEYTELPPPDYKDAIHSSSPASNFIESESETEETFEDIDPPHYETVIIEKHFKLPPNKAKVREPPRTPVTQQETVEVEAEPIKN